jgi:hypothetical protein
VAGRLVGIDRATGAVRQVYTIIANAGGLVTGVSSAGGEMGLTVVRETESGASLGSVEDLSNL